MAGQPSQNNQGKSSDWFSWTLIVFLFAVGVWPIALFLLFIKLFGSDERKKRTAPSSARTERPQENGTAAHSRAQSAARNVVRSPATKKSNARGLKIAGIILAAIGVFSLWGPLSIILLSGWAAHSLGGILQAIAFMTAGGAMFLSGMSMDRAIQRYARYAAMIGQRDAVPLEELSQKTGYRMERTIRDLQKMIEKNYFGAETYLDEGQRYFFRSAEAEETLRRRNASAQPPREAEEGYSGILRNIRRANDRIADPELSAKIDRLEEITAKIFRAVEEDPQKRPRIDTFLNYYLPTTQKLLDSYAEFESTGVEGENLRAAKENIRRTMDSVVAGFAHQLDELYKADAMDVDSDIRVMENMLRRDTASVERDFGLGEKSAAGTWDCADSEVDLGGTAAQRKKEE